jgi:glyceraldehyde-3-phosphate dehydrogenase/erythrose-4-phosphate dehydrogenase
LHWSIRDPVEAGTGSAFDTALADLDDRITTIAVQVPERGDERWT